MNRARLAIYVSVGFFLAGGLLFFGAVCIALPNAAATKSMSGLQAAIHTADEIEVSFLADPQTQPDKRRYRTKKFPEDYAITSTRVLTAAETKDFLGILERHVYSVAGGAMCHDPGFLLRFKRQGHTILMCSLCLHCTNVELEPFPFVSIWVGILDMKAQGPHLPRIETFLSKLDGP